MFGSKMAAIRLNGLEVAWKAPGKILVLAIGAALSMCMLSACSQPASAPESSSASEAEAVATIDTSSWKTLGDALAAQTESVATGYDENYFISVFKAGDSLVRVVAKSDEATAEKAGGLDFLAEDYDKQLAEVVGGLELVSAEDLTPGIPAQEELEGFVGKKGSDLEAAGYEFESYFMTGGDQTGAYYEKGYYALNVTFDVKVAEDAGQKDEDGKDLKDAVISEVTFAGPSEAATDPIED